MDVIPQNYKLEFTPNFRDFVFDGVAEIAVTCLKKTSTIKLDVEEITVESCSVRVADLIFEPKFTVNKSKGLLTINMRRQLQGECVVTIRYQGILNDKLIGFYRSIYKVGSKTKYLATSQFEAADARHAFPCFDRPDLKATFDVTIIAPKNMTAISNMPIENTETVKNGTKYVFKTTPKMSTYLLYLGVGEFEYLTGKGKVRVVTTAGKSKQGKFALELAEKLIPMYEQYFAKFYKLPKLDLVALPDFASGAMENWGAMTFRENLLLYDEKSSSSLTKQLVAEVLSHELAHQWFGNLVTMKWWNDLWLNESFATFMATKTLDWIYPSWNLWEQFVNSASSTAMELDFLESTHPIDVEVESPSQIREIFDAISYEKGGSLLRMIEDYVGKLVFRAGLRLYVRNFQFDNATGVDLWDSIDDSIKELDVKSKSRTKKSKRVPRRDIANMSVRKVMEPWLKISGFPVVSVTQNNDKVTLRQDPFKLTEPQGRTSTWPIPVTISSKSPDIRILMNKKTQTLDLSGRFIVNPKRMGFYRVHYQKEILDEIKKSVQKKTISGMDRWAIQNDLFAMCLAGRASVPDYLDFVDAYSNERKYLPLINIGQNLSLLLNMSHSQDWNGMVRDHALPVFENMLEWLGWEPSPGEPHTNSFLRSMTLVSLGRLDTATSDRTAKLFEKYVSDRNKVHPDIQMPMFAAVARNGGVREYSKLSKLFAASDSVEEQLRIATGMCEFNNPNMLLRTLKFSLTNKVRAQNIHDFILPAARNPNSRGILWPWIRDNWDPLSSKFGAGDRLLSRIVYGVAMATDGSEYGEIKKFFTKKRTGGIERTSQQLLERIKMYSDFRKQAAQDISAISS